MRIVAYERVSTARQGTSGRGFEARRAAIGRFAAERGAEVVGRFTEIESGRCPDRPELARALQVTGAVLVIAKLDRLTCNAAYLLTLRDSGGALPRGGPAGGERPHRRHHGARRRGRAGGDLAAHEGGAGGGECARLGNPNGAVALRRAGKGTTAIRAAICAQRRGQCRSFPSPRRSDCASTAIPSLPQCRNGSLTTTGRRILSRRW
jgi:hypothetical protein